MNVFESGWAILYTEEEWRDYLGNLGSTYVHFGEPYDFPFMVKTIFIPSYNIDAPARAKHVFVYYKDASRFADRKMPPMPTQTPPITAPQTPSAKIKSGEYRFDLPKIPAPDVDEKTCSYCGYPIGSGYCDQSHP